MAVHCATVSDYLQRTTGLMPASNSARTVMLWYRANTAYVATNFTAFVALDDPAIYTDYAGLFQDSANVLLGMAGTTDTSTAYVSGPWVHLCWTQSGTSQKFYRNGTLIGTRVDNISGFTFGFELLGNDTFSDGDVDLEQCRQWTSTLTAGQILTEMQSTSAVITSNLWLDTPLISNLLDISGNSRNWTGIGSISFVTGPNNSATTATVLADPPSSITQTFTANQVAWYAFTPSDDALLVGFWAYATSADNIHANVFLGPASAPTSWIVDQANSVPLEIPTTNGTTFYVKVTAFATPAAPVVISLVPAPTTAAPTGSILINDDTDGFPMALLSSTTGLPLSFVTYPAGESVEVIPATGQTLANDIGSDVLRLIDVDFAVEATVPYPSAGPVGSISSDQDALYYVGLSGDEVWSIDTSGTPVDHWTLGSTLGLAIAPSLDNTILYYFSTNAAVKRWDLVNDTALSDLLAGVGGHLAAARDILVLQDGSVVFSVKVSGVHSIYNYAADGTLLHTYTGFDSGVQVNHLTHAIDDPNSFWAWFYLADGTTSRFTNIKVSDGSSIVTFDQVQFEVGVYSGDITDTPLRFSHSNSCPFWISRGVSPTPTPPSEVIVDPIRWERVLPHLSQENKWQTFSQAQLDIETGVGLTTGQGSDPQVFISWSDDGGHTWSSDYLMAIGKKGDYTKRVMRYMMGRSRDRVYRFSGSDPVVTALISLYAEVQLGTS